MSFCICNLIPATYSTVKMPEMLQRKENLIMGLYSKSLAYFVIISAKTAENIYFLIYISMVPGLLLLGAGKESIF